MAVSAPGRDSVDCRADFGNLGQELARQDEAPSKIPLDTEQHRKALAWLRQNLFGHRDPDADRLFGRIQMQRGAPTINGAVITSGSDYRLVDIKNNLRLTEDFMHTIPRDAKVLSVGEGISELAENLRIKFPDTKALDLWYDDQDLPKELAEYVASHRPYLIAGSATEMPVKSRSIDLLVSHMLINNLDGPSRLKSLDEMIRVLKVGGEARIAFASDPKSDIAGFLQKRYGNEITVSSEAWRSKWKTRMINHDGQTLTIRRVRNGTADN